MKEDQELPSGEESQDLLMGRGIRSLRRGGSAHPRDRQRGPPGRARWGQGGLEQPGSGTSQGSEEPRRVPAPGRSPASPLRGGATGTLPCPIRGGASGEDHPGRGSRGLQDRASRRPPGSRSRGTGPGGHPRRPRGALRGESQGASGSSSTVALPGKGSGGRARGTRPGKEESIFRGLSLKRNPYIQPGVFSPGVEPILS